MDLMVLVAFLGGIVALVLGAYALIEGGVKVARILGIPSVVVGLTVVAFGTSAPEFFVSLVGALRGSTALALGNVMGSNVANLGLILAAGGLMRPLVVGRDLARREIPLVVLATLVFGALAWDGTVSRIDAAILTAGFLGFMAWTVCVKREPLAAGLKVPVPSEVPTGEKRVWRGIVGGSFLTLGGILGLALGGKLITDSAVAVAQALGVSEDIIGLTMVAVGTSLPELATTIMASLRGEGELALGNIFGSNLFNILGIAGPVGMIKPLVSEPGGVPLVLPWLTLSKFQLQVVTLEVITLLVLVMVMTRGGTIGRWRAGLLLLFYAGITVSWIL